MFVGWRSVRRNGALRCTTGVKAGLAQKVLATLTEYLMNVKPLLQESV